MVKGDEIVNSLVEQRMTLLCKNEVVRHTNWDSLWENNGIYEERVQGAKASYIQIKVYSTIMMKDEITNCVGTLYGVGIAVECF
jgi:hypothetical protein